MQLYFSTNQPNSFSRLYGGTLELSAFPRETHTAEDRNSLHPTSWII